MQKSVLIIDDEELPRKALEKKFSAGHFLVFAADNGKAGLEIALSTHPDIILLDIKLPKMGGLAVLEHLRLDAWGRSVPIIILTNLPLDDRELVYVVNYHPAYYLEKTNASLDEVVAKTKELLGLQ
jgi:DNA-binding response OmpR family regulator